MRTKIPLAPREPDVTVHIVLNDLGRRAPPMSKPTRPKLMKQPLSRTILSGQYSHPMRVIAFNTAEGWSRDVTEDIARAVLTKARNENRSVGIVVQEFLDKSLGVDA